MRKIDRFRDDIVEYETESVDDAIVVLAYGSVARSSLRASTRRTGQGNQSGLFPSVTLWPFPDKEIEKLARKVKTIIVPELNCGQMVLEVERAVHGRAKVLPVNLIERGAFQARRDSCRN